MKRILSIFAVVAMLASLFCVNVSAAVPTTTGGEWTVLISDNFDSGEATYFKNIRGSLNGVTFVPETEGSDNTVIDLKLGEKYTQLETDPEYDKYYNNVRIGAGSQGKDEITADKVLDGTYMIEFDVNGVNPVVNLAIGVRGTHSSTNAAAMCIKLNPNYMEKNTWYTYRILVESTDTMDINEATTTVYRKLRGSNEGFVKLEGATIGAWNGTQADEKDYGIYGMYLNDTITFGITSNRSYAKPYINGMNTAVERMVVGHDGATLVATGADNCYTAAIDTHYQIDNITVYTKAAEADYELSQGIITKWDMEDDTTVPLKTGSLKIEDTNGDKIVDTNDKWMQYPVNTVELENNGNQYVKFTPSVAPFAAATDYFVKFPLDVALPETFILSFDANNASLGAALDIVINGDSDGTTNGSYPRNTLYFRSHKGIEDKWYSYKVVCSATPKQAGEFSFTVYRKERGSDAPYTKLDGVGWAGREEATVEKDFGWASTMSGSLEWANTLQIGHNRRGFLSYYTTSYANNGIVSDAEEKANHENVAWFIDNIMVTEANALTANFDVEENVLSADVNLSTVAATSAPVLAVYDGGRLVDVDFDALSHTGSVALAVDYDASALTAPTAKFFVWEDMGKAPLVEEIDIASYIAE